jgi:hypothetical protein
VPRQRHDERAIDPMSSGGVERWQRYRVPLSRLLERVGVRAAPHDGWNGVATRTLTLTLSHFMGEGNASGLRVNRLDIQPYAFLLMPFLFSGIGRYSGIAFSDGIMGVDDRGKSDNQTYAFPATDCSG